MTLPVPSTAMPTGSPKGGADPEIVPELRMLPEKVEMLATERPTLPEMVPLVVMLPVNVVMPLAETPKPVLAMILPELVIPAENVIGKISLPSSMPFDLAVMVPLLVMPPATDAPVVMTIPLPKLPELPVVAVIAPVLTTEPVSVLLLILIPVFWLF